MLKARFEETAPRAGPPFLEVSAGNFQFTRNTNLYYVEATVKDGQQTNGFESLLEETARVRAHGFLASELERAKREQVAQLQRAYAEREKTESRSLAASMVSSYLNGEPETGIEAGTQLAQALLPGITLAEVNALADTLISTRNRVVLADGPDKAGVPLPAEAELRAIIERMGAAKPSAWVDQSAGRALMARLAAPGEVASKRVIDELGV